MRIGIVACALAVSTVAHAGHTGGPISDSEMTVGPRRIYINAYETEDKVTIAPTKVTARFDFRDYVGSEVFSLGDGVRVRFGLLFDPDNVVLGGLVDAIPEQLAPYADDIAQDSWDGMTVQAPIELPASMKKFSSWCTTTGTTYTIDGIVWASLPDIYDGVSNVRAFSNVSLVVKCLKKVTTIKYDAKKVPAKLKEKLTAPTPKP